MRISVHDEPGLRVVRLEDPTLELPAARNLANRLAEYVADADTVAIDLACVRYADTFGFEALLASVAGCAGRLVFVGAAPDLESLFILANLDRHLHCFATIAEAKAFLQAENRRP